MPARAPVALVLALSLALTSCTPMPSDAARIRGRVVPDVTGPLGVGLIWLEAAQLVPAAPDVGTSVVFEPVDGVYVSGVAPLDQDLAFALALPAGAELEPAVLVPAEGFLLNLVPQVDCAIVADDPSAQVIGHYFAFVAFPGPYAATFAGYVPAFASDAAIDQSGPDNAAVFGGRKLITWLYATRAVQLTTSGSACGLGFATASVDLDLEAGWNQVAWTVNADATAVALGNDATTPVVLTIAQP